ncbi:hypothetical protein [Pseudoxanthomonas gei]|uniref:hypothetical protein n=1 Tax=Pseudoxanthomonas gei TaxID=1383030 RepID=UPI0013920BC9|nr:hypothetical protein [Pseudoxanthomonas gei]
MPSPLPFLRSWRHRHRTALRRVAMLLALLYALYLLLANVFLNTPLSALAFNQKPERFHIEWRSAFSLYPGHIHARGIKVGGHARTTMWSASSAGADGRIKMLPLLARRLSFGTIHARDVQVGVDRVATDLAPSLPRSAAALARGPWELHFDGISTASLQRIRVGDWVVEGQGHARFGLHKVLRGGPVEVTPSTLRMPAATVRRGALELAREARVELDLEMAPNTRKQAQGYDKVRFVDAHLRVDGHAPGLGVTEGAQGKLALASSGQDGRVQVDLVLSRGALQPGGTLRWNAPVTLDSASASAQGYRLQLDADVRNDGVAVHARVPRRPGREDAIDLRLHLAERRLLRADPEALLGKTSGTVKGRWHFATLRWINPMLSDGWLRLDGAADVVADLRLRQGRLVSGSHAEVLDAEVVADVFDTVASGHATARATMEDGRTNIDFVAQRFALAPRASRQQAYVQGSDLSLGLTASGQLSEFRRTMQARVRFAGARIPDLRAYNPSLPAGSLQFEGGTGTLGADLQLDAKGQLRRGELRLTGRRADVRFGPSRVVGDLTLDSRLVRAQGGPHRYRIESLKLGLDGVQVGDARPTDGPWWARLDFEEGSLDWQQPISLQGNARVVMKDVSALLDLYADRSAFPKWVGKLIDAGQADATARVRLDGDAVTIDALRARNQRIDLDARMRMAKGQSTGALYARWGVLGLGAETSGGQHKLHLLKARQWYDGLPAMTAGKASP